jgi:hypothetical protein
MNLPDPRTEAAFNAAAQFIKSTAQSAVERVSTNLGMLALSAHRAIERDALMDAQLDLQRNMGDFMRVFNDTIGKKIAQEINPQTDSRRKLESTDWHTLSLVNDSEVEEQLFADRISQAINHGCEWELREMAAYVGALLSTGQASHERNPFRPEIVGSAVFRAIVSSSNNPEVRKLLAKELGSTLAHDMPQCYANILKDFRARGITPVNLSVRGVEGPGNELTRDRVNSGYDTIHNTSTSSATNSLQGNSHLGASHEDGDTQSSGRRSGARHSGFGGGSSRPSVSNQADLELMTLLRRLTILASRPVGLDDYADALDPSNLATKNGRPGYSSSDSDQGHGFRRTKEINLIHAHRDALVQASTGTLDHMVIDVVGSLFDQILSDTRVPPQMARQIARLQLPVLRVALNDTTFFSSRKHPVRKFVNRIASLACAFDDFDTGPGKKFLERVQSLVEEIVLGDFDQIDIYAAKLNELESFIAQQTKESVEKTSAANAVVDDKESDLRIQQRYMQQLQAALTPISMQTYLRSFLSQVWSQALTLADKRDGPKSDLVNRFKRVGRDLVLSVQPKGSPAMRKKFLMQLPPLMKDLNEGLLLVGWPDIAKKEFFGKLLPAHAESLKGSALSELEYNLLAKQLEGIFNITLPEADGQLHEVQHIGASSGEMPIEARFSPEEAKQIGLVAESAVNWSGEVRSDLNAQNELAQTHELTTPTPLGQNVESVLPEHFPDTTVEPIRPLTHEIDVAFSPSDPEEPSQGDQLIHHVQLGFSYQMSLNEEWQKVRLNYISPGRAFFVFGCGKGLKETVSLTSRMLSKMCGNGRFKAFESSYLIERATARARKQLAALGAQHKVPQSVSGRDRNQFQ